jgi:hypothetical protein
MQKGRHAPPPVTDWPHQIVNGSGHHWQKLSIADVTEIRRRLKAGEKLVSIADDFGVSFQQISKIKLRKRWFYLGERGLIRADVEVCGRRW